MRQESAIEATLALHLRALKFPVFERNYRVIPGRKFEIDFCWPSMKCGVEVQGMVHRIESKFKADMSKRALLMLAGWRILEVGGAEIRSGQAIAWIEQLIYGRG